MPSLVMHAPECQIIVKNKKSFTDTFETGIGRGYALNSTILRQISPGCQVVLLCKDRECRAEGILVKLEPGIKDGEPWFTTNHIRRYNVYVEKFEMVPYKSEKLNKNGVAVI